MSKLDDILKPWAAEMTPDLKGQIKALFQHIILDADKNPDGGETSHELAVLSGRKETIIELFEKVNDL